MTTRHLVDPEILPLIDLMPFTGFTRESLPAARVASAERFAFLGEPPLAPQVLALRMDAELDFASASALEQNLAERLAEHPEVRHVCLFAQPINRIDVTGVETFARLQAMVLVQGSTLHISGLKLPVEEVLLRAKVLLPGPHLHIYRSETAAVHALQQLAQEKSGETGPLRETQSPQGDK